jgi:hypothetical protein
MCDFSEFSKESHADKSCILCNSKRRSILLIAISELIEDCPDGTNVFFVPSFVKSSGVQSLSPHTLVSVAFPYCEFLTPAAFVASAV